MDRPPVFSLEVLADQLLLRDVLKGVLCTIFFHRFFSLLRPNTRELLDMTLPTFDEPELDSTIDQRTTQLIKAIETTSTMGSKANKGQLAVQFYERRPRKAWFTKAEEKVCWEQWVLNVTLIAPRTDMERAKARKMIETQLQSTIVTIITTACSNHGHVPPITTNESNPFPYQIVVEQKGETWGTRMGIF